MSISDAKHADEVANYFESHLITSTPELQHTYANSAAHGIPPIAISPAQGKFLSLLTTVSGAKNVLELGTLGGYSGICFAKALKERGGKLTSIEIDSTHREVATENIRRAKAPAQEHLLCSTHLNGPLT